MPEASALVAEEMDRIMSKLLTENSHARSPKST